MGSKRKAKNTQMTIEHVGILLAVLGTVLLAFAVKIENKHTLSAQNKKEKEAARKLVADAEDGTYLEPSIVLIDKMLFRFGLACVAIGSLMQW